MLRQIVWQRRMVKEVDMNPSSVCETDAELTCFSEVRRVTEFYVVFQRIFKLKPAPSSFILLVVPMPYFCCGSNCFIFWCRIVVPCAPNARFHILVEFWKLSDCLLGNSCLLVILLVILLVYDCQFSFFNLDFWSGNFFLIAPFSDHCLLVPF